MDEAQPKVPFPRAVPRSSGTRLDAATGAVVHVKRFHAAGWLGRVRDRRRASSERDALERLLGRGLRVPAPLGIHEDDGGVELVTHAIPGAVTLRDAVLGRAPFPRGPERAAREVGAWLAGVCAAGALPPDLHAGNVVLDATGDAWLVDVRGTRLSAGMLADEDATRLLVVLAADLRECAPPRWRARAWLAFRRAWEALGGAARPEAGPRRRARAAAAVERASRARRREVLVRSARRWLRASGAVRPFACALGTGFAPHDVALERLVDAADDATLVRVGGDGAFVAAAWRDAARLVEHGLAVHAPLALVTEPESTAVFDPRGATLGLADLARATAGTRARAAREWGALAGGAWDRGLSFRAGARSSVRFDARGSAAVPAGARLELGDLDDPHAWLADVDVCARRELAQAAPTRFETGRFLIAFARAAGVDVRARTRPRAPEREAETASDEARRRTEMVVAASDVAARSRTAPTVPRAPRREKLRRVVRARLLAGFARASGFVPHPLVRGALTAVAPLASWSRFERVTRANLELALGRELTRERRDEIARGVRRFAARQFSEWLRLANSAPPDTRDAARGAWIEDYVVFDDSVTILERELARGRGALVVTAHLGNWELLAARVRRAGHRGVVVGYRRPHDSSAAWLEDMRRAYGVETLAQDGNPRAILRALARGDVVGLLADLEVRRLDGVFLPFFGVEALTMTAPAALARASGRPLLPASCTFDAERGRYRVAFEEPLELDPSLEKRAAAVDLTRRLNAVFERWVRAHPEQWAWHQPRWRTRPGTLVPRPLGAPRGAAPAARAPRAGAGAAASLQRPDQDFAGD